MKNTIQRIRTAVQENPGATAQLMAVVTAVIMSAVALWRTRR